MIDYGVFQEIQKLVRRHNFLSEKLEKVYTQAPANVECPFMTFTFKDVLTDSHIPPRRVRLDFLLTLYSDYTGLKEIAQLMRLTILELERAVLSHIRFQVSGQSINLGKDQRTRTGVIGVCALIRTTERRGEK